MEEANKTLEKNIISAHGMNEKIVPKLCTSVNFALLGNRMVLMTLTYNENNSENHIIIERVVLDIELAKSMSNVLTEFIRSSENGNIINAPLNSN